MSFALIIQKIFFKKMSYNLTFSAKKKDYTGVKRPKLLPKIGSKKTQMYLTCFGCGDLDDPGWFGHSLGCFGYHKERVASGRMQSRNQHSGFHGIYNLLLEIGVLKNSESFYPFQYLRKIHRLKIKLYFQK